MPVRDDPPSESTAGLAEASPPPNAWSHERLEIIIGSLLRIGVGAAALVVLAGGILYLRIFGGTHPNYGRFHGEPRNLRTISGIIQGVGAAQPMAIMQLGLLLLIATPIARVIFSAFGFWRERDYRYVVITLIVLAVLMFSILKPG